MLVFGDGDGFSTGQFSGAQDVVSHELSHRVTECRAPLTVPGPIRSPERGVLGHRRRDDRAGSQRASVDAIAAARTGQAGCPGLVGRRRLDPGRARLRLPKPDRSRSDRSAQPLGGPICLTCFFDNGGVHINSTIATHAFYLMVNGGRNARCSGANDPQADCDVVVPTIPLADASQIVFGAWAALTDNATFCDAHDATVADAESCFRDRLLTERPSSSPGTPLDAAGRTVTRRHAADGQSSIPRLAPGHCRSADGQRNRHRRDRHRAGRRDDHAAR